MDGEDALPSQARDQVSCDQCDAAVVNALQQARPSRLFAVVRDKLAEVRRRFDVSLAPLIAASVRVPRADTHWT